MNDKTNKKTNKTGRMGRHIYVWVGHTVRKDHTRTTRPGQDYTDLELKEVPTKTTKKPRWIVNIRDHTKKLDQNTGKPIEMVRIYLPKGHYNFPKDSNGYSRNNRRAYIQLPKNCLESSGYNDLELVFLNSRPVFKVYFENRRLGPKNSIQQYEPNVETVTVTTEELMDIFKDPWVDKVLKELDLKKKKRKRIKPKHIKSKKKVKKIQVSEEKNVEKQSQKESKQPGQSQSSKQTGFKSKQMLNDLKNRTSDFSQDKGRENALER